MAETGNCTTGMGAKKNNCFGIMKFWIEKGVRHRTGKTYKTKQDSYEDFKRIWLTHYKRYPDYALADKWTGKDKTQTWLDTVNFYYSK